LSVADLFLCNADYLSAYSDKSESKGSGIGLNVINPSGVKAFKIGPTRPVLSRNHIASGREPEMAASSLFMVVHH
jgi:hypothetical protein